MHNNKNVICALCVMCFTGIAVSIVLAETMSGVSSENTAELSSLSELRLAVYEAEAADPDDECAIIDGGEYTYDGLSVDEDITLLLSLLRDSGGESKTYLTAWIYMDHESGELVFLDDCGWEVLRFTDEEGAIPVMPAWPADLSGRIILSIGILLSSTDTVTSSSASGASCSGDSLPHQRSAAGDMTVQSSTGQVARSAVMQESSGSDGQTFLLENVHVQNARGGCIYVDRVKGSDLLTGHHPRSRGNFSVDGPKRTIHGGLAVACDGNEVRIATGTYNEGINVSGRQMTVRVDGVVRLAKR